MSILIHGIEMPKDECGFLMAFTLNEKGEWLCANMNECKWRTVEVLPPHGRLIDADDVLTQIRQNEWCSSYQQGQVFGWNSAIEYIGNFAPTVIESEE